MTCHARAWLSLIAAGVVVFFTVSDAAQLYSQRPVRAQREVKAVDGSAGLGPGTYTASSGGTAATSSAAGGGRFARMGGKTGATASQSGSNVTVNVSSFSTSAEIQQVAAAGESGVAAAIQALPSKGTVTIAGSGPVEIKLATNAKVGANYAVYILSAVPFGTAQAGPRGRTAQGGSVGMIEMTIPGDMSAGSGKLYTSTQVVVSQSGAVTSRGGASTATALTNVVYTK